MNPINQIERKKQVPQKKLLKKINKLNIPQNYKILISACLLNQKVRYDGNILGYTHPVVNLLYEYDLLIPVCPEVEGGLPVPRKPIELRISAEKVWAEKRGILTKDGMDLTLFLLNGINSIMQKLDQYIIEYAILKENSPSCGVNQIYNGTFSNKKIQGKGVFTHILQNKNIKVFNEYQVNDLKLLLQEKFDLFS